MGEFLPLFMGCLIGITMVHLRTRSRVIAPLSCVAAGALASAVNGELHGAFWSVFVSVDSALVWLAAAVTTGLIWTWRRVSAAG